MDDKRVKSCCWRPMRSREEGWKWARWRNVSKSSEWEACHRCLLVLVQVKETLAIVVTSSWWYSSLSSMVLLRVHLNWHSPSTSFSETWEFKTWILGFSNCRSWTPLQSTTTEPKIYSLWTLGKLGNLDRSLPVWAPPKGRRRWQKPRKFQFWFLIFAPLRVGQMWYSYVHLMTHDWRLIDYWSCYKILCKTFPLTQDSIQ